jgi:fructokinase
MGQDLRKDLSVMKKTIVGIGEILWDLLPSGKQMGGAPANFACHVNNLGKEGIIVACIGNDDLGKEILNTLDGMALNNDFVVIDTTHPTGTVQVLLDDKGAPTFTIQEEVAWDYLRTTLELLDLAQKIDVVCFGSLAQRSSVSRNTVRTFLETTRAEALRIFDINLRQSFYSEEIIEYSLNIANILKLNERELQVVASLTEIEGDEQTLMGLLSEQYNLGLVALTRGANGSDIYQDGKFFIHEGFSVEVVDTVGAGDAFTAALALGRLKGFDPHKINDIANRVASFVCTQEGATPEIPKEIKNLF